MAKELPYFKFEPSEYLSGDISFCSLEAQGYFNIVKCHYWVRLGILTKSQILKRSNHTKLLQELIDESVLKYDQESDMISINFLDEQIKERNATRAINKVNGAKGGRPKKTEKKPTAFLNETELKAKQKAIEEKRVEESIKEKKRKEKKTDFSIETKKCFKECLNYFPDHLKPKSLKQQNEWLDCVDKLNRIDNIPFEHIIKITRLAREDEFWSGKFLSLTKLRTKNKEKIKYIIVFNENLHKNGKSKTTTGAELAAEYLRKKREGQ